MDSTRLQQIFIELRADEAVRPTPADQGLTTLILATAKIMKTRFAEPLLELNPVAWHRGLSGNPLIVHVLYQNYLAEDIA